MIHPTFDSPSPLGFGLERLEVLNWGTFGGNCIWSLTPCGQSSLLTGANASGKSTMVDALLTLLVPPGRRSYNQASGADRKRERDEKTYVLGAYGKAHSEEDALRDKNLRDKKSYSILLGRFVHSNTRRTATLAQIFWFDEQGALQKFFVFSEAALSIQDHLTPFKHPRDLKLKLKKMLHTEVFDHFAGYSARFRKAVGLRSEKALDLFQQTVAIKSIGDLNAFVRDHMLERFDARDRIQELLRNYENLTQSYEAIRTDKEKLELLNPLMEEKDKRDSLQAAWQELEEYAAMVAPFLAHEAIGLIEADQQDKRIRTETLNADLRVFNGDIDSLGDSKQQLHAAIESDETGRRLRDLEKSLKDFQKVLEGRTQSSEQYNRLARNLGLEIDPNRQAFEASLRHSLDLEVKKREEQNVADEDWASAKAERDELSKTTTEMNAEIEFLKQRKSQISPDLLRLRSEIASSLELDEATLPFAGEIIRVKPGEDAWEGALERLLRSFALRLIVPDSHYRAVSQYVNQRHLGLLLRFQRLEGKRQFGFERDLDPAAAAKKLEVKPDSPYRSWMSQELAGNFDHVCCSDLERFQSEAKALTMQGLIKAGRSLHEKDDRNGIGDRTRFLLGWDNAKKLLALQARLRELEIRKTNLGLKIEAAKQRRGAIQSTLMAVNTFSNLKDFSSIDWRSAQQEVDDTQGKIRELESASDKLAQLREELAAVIILLKKKNEERDGLMGELAVLRNAIKENVDLDRYYREELEAVDSAKRDRYFPLLSPIILKDPLILNEIEDRKSSLKEFFRTQIDDKKAHLNGIELSMVGRMAAYLNKYPLEKEHAHSRLEFLEQFAEFHRRIKQDDLPAHESRFKSLLNESVINDIVNFHQALVDHEEGIREKIEELNRTLKEIEFSPSTFIQLLVKKSRDVEIRHFQDKLVECIPDVGVQEGTEREAERSFFQLKPILDDFKSNSRWTEKVTDVRQWLEFSASERYRESGQEKRFYSDSDGLSGGQKAKLAYTILASAIAYQYGLAETSLDEAHSEDAIRPGSTFRFVALDEAFSRSDEANSRFAMDLFRKLGLQLLLVTPLDKINVVEPYIAACHFACNSEEQDNSRIYDLTMEEYRIRKSEWEKAVA